MNTADEGISFSFHKNYKLSPTYPRLAIFPFLDTISNELAPLSALRAETSSRYQSDPPENQTCHADEGGASLACYQSTLFSGTSFFSQLYFPSSGRSANEILWEIVASSPILCPLCQLNPGLIKSKFVSEFVGTDKPTDIMHSFFEMRICKGWIKTWTLW